MNKIEFGELELNVISKRHIQDCLDSNYLTMGKKVTLFENCWKKLFGYKYTSMVSSGTTADTAACMALYSANMCLRRKPEIGDEIICPALSFIATANSIRAAGFVPRFVDVDMDTMNIDPTKIEEAINEKTVAIMPVNLMGRPAELDAIHNIAVKHLLGIIVDNCEGYGCKLDGEYSLKFADFETTSHYVAHIVCSVEGGTVSSKSNDYDQTIKSIRSHGREPDSLYFDHQRFGLNFKPSDLHASVGLGEIDNFWQRFYRRKCNLDVFFAAVQDFREIAWFSPEDDKRYFCAPHAFSITLKPSYAEGINYLKQELTDANISWKRNFGSMPHHGAFRYLKQHYACAFPNAQYIGNHGIHIGCHYYLTDDNLQYISETLKRICKNIKRRFS